MAKVKTTQRIVARMPSALGYKLGEIDTKLVQNDIAHQEIIKNLDCIRETLSEVKDTVIGQVATIKTQVGVNTKRLDTLETNVPIIKGDVDKIVGKASMLGGIISFGVAFVAWFGKKIIEYVIGH